MTTRRPPVAVRLHNGPRLTTREAAALHGRPERVAWFVLPAPSGNGVVARAHTEAHDGGRLLPGHLAADDVEGLRAMLPPGLEFDAAPSPGSPPGCLGWWFAPVDPAPDGDGRSRRLRRASGAGGGDGPG